MKLLGGRSLPLQDEYYRASDNLLLPMCISGARTALSVRHLNPGYLKAVVGHNLATRSEAYEQSGGFPRSSIDKLDEDVEYSLRIYNKFGWRAIKFDSEMQVSTSMRRIRTYGLIRTSLHHLVPEIRHKVHKGEIDIR